MSEKYNFEPDYAAWWKRKNLTKEQLIWLMLGINPDDMAKHKELERKLNISEEEKDWKWAFDGINGYLDSLYGYAYFLSDRFENYNQGIRWKNKKQFITDAYKFYFRINDAFLTHLEKIGDFKKDPELEDFKDHKKYKYDFDKFHKNIKTEDNAFYILLGLEPEFFIRFHKLNTKIKNMSGDKNNGFRNFSPKIKWFYWEYKKFLESLYGELAYFTLLDALKKAKELNIWNGDFTEYCQALYDEGFIFKSEVYALLGAKGIELKYSQESWPIQFYEYWKKRGGGKYQKPYIFSKDEILKKESATFWI